MVTANNRIIDKAYINDLSKSLTGLEKRASDTMKSFADFVSELNKVSKLSSGTPVKEQITKLAGELNNSSVFFAQMIGQELGKIHETVHGTTDTSAETITS